MKIISVSNQKGGVGKSTTAYNLGASLSLMNGLKILLIDIDPQANLSEYLGYEPEGNPTMTSLILSVCTSGVVSAETVAKSIRHCKTAGVDYIPADINLAGTEAMMSTVLSRETILKRIISKIDDKSYDYIIIDCLPSLGTLLINALTASDKILIPVQTQKFSLDGLQALENLYRQIKTNLNPALEISGVLATMTDRTLVCRNAMRVLSEKYGALLFQTSISKSVSAPESAESKVPLCTLNGKLGNEYNQLSMEVLSK